MEFRKFFTSLLVVFILTGCSLFEPPFNASEQIAIAKNSIQSYLNVENYYDDEKTNISELLNQYNNSLDDCMSQSEIDALVLECKGKLDAIKTKTQIDTEKAESLNLLKIEKCNELDTWLSLNSSKYDNDELVQIQAIINNSKTIIDNASSEALVLQTYNSATTSISTIKTSAEKAEIAEELASYKSGKEVEVDDYFNSIKENYYSEQQTEIANLISSFKNALSEITSKENVDSRYELLLSEISEVKTKIDIDNPYPVYVVSNYYDGYYSSLSSWTDGNDLKNKLHNIISGGNYKALSYAGNTTNWETNQYADQDLFEFSYLDGLYTSDTIDKKDTNTGWQREHAFCASLMCGGVNTGDAVKFLGRSTDFHNLFAARSTGNMSRGNKNFGEVDKTQAYTVGSIDKNESGLDYLYQDNNFEPSDYDKGRVARAIFYMTVMYNENVNDTKNNIQLKPLEVVEDNVTSSSSNYGYAHGNKSSLLRWAHYPVDDLEYQHNESVYSHVLSIDGYAQGNRNPLVDYPDLIDYLYGDKANEPGELKYLKPSYESLEMGKDKIRNYAFTEDCKKTYSIGDVFHKDDLDIVSVGKNQTKTKVDSFTVVGINEGETLNSIGSKEITIKIGDDEVKYIINVVEVDPIASSKYHYTFSGTSFTNKSTSYAGTIQEITLGDIKWDSCFATGKIYNMSGNGYGLGIGTSTDNVTKLTLESKTSFDNINRLAFSGAAADGCSYQIKMYINDNEVYTATIGYVKNEQSTVSITLDNPVSGKVKFEILNNYKKSFYIGSIGIDYE